LRFVFDTNVIVSALLLQDSLPRQAVDAGLAHGTILISTDTLTELDEVLSRKRFNKYIEPEDRKRFLAVKGASD